MPSAPELPLGVRVSCSQELGHRSALPTKEYLMSDPLMALWLCHPQ